MTKNKMPDLFTAMLLGLLSNVLLRTQTAFWTGAGAAAAPISAVILLCAGWSFSRCWRAWPNTVFRAAFAVLLVFSSALELLRLWKLSVRVYPDTITWAAVCLMALLPVIYLRRVSAIAQTANVLVWMLFLSGVLMLVSVFPQLRVENLQCIALDQDSLLEAARAQLILYPEYLLPALWPEQDKRGRHTVLRLAALALLFDVGAHFLLELFFGAAMPGRMDPLHAAARSGVISIFNRMEWLQLLLWMMVISVKMALYLYALYRLCGMPCQKERHAVALRHFPVYFGGMLLLCAVLRKTDVEQAFALRNASAWLFASMVWIGGGMVCITAKRSSSR